MNFTRHELQKAINNALSMADVLRNLSLPEGGGYRRKLKKMIETHGLDISHLNGRKATSKKNTIWRKIRKSCPVCGNCFETQLGHPREKQTCSYSCSNTHFRSGENNPNWKEISSQYRDICFQLYDHKCIVCEETEILDVHHLDGNRLNNDISNLIPLCPTHHAYIHRGKENLIWETIEQNKL